MGSACSPPSQCSAALRGAASSGGVTREQWHDTGAAACRNERADVHPRRRVGKRETEVRPVSRTTMVTLSPGHTHLAHTPCSYALLTPCSHALLTRSSPLLTLAVSQTFAAQGTWTPVAHGSGRAPTLSSQVASARTMAAHRERQSVASGTSRHPPACSPRASCI